MWIFTLKRILHLIPILLGVSLLSSSSRRSFRVIFIPNSSRIRRSRPQRLRSRLSAPGVAIFITVLAFNFVGDGPRDAVDTKTAA